MTTITLTLGRDKVKQNVKDSFAVALRHTLRRNGLQIHNIPACMADNTCIVIGDDVYAQKGATT